MARTLHRAHVCATIFWMGLDILLCIFHQVFPLIPMRCDIFGMNNKPNCSLTLEKNSQPVDSQGDGVSLMSQIESYSSTCLLEWTTWLVVPYLFDLEAESIILPRPIYGAEVSIIIWDVEVKGCAYNA